MTLNLPVTSSLSMSLGVGTTTKVTVSDEDRLTLNGNLVAADSSFAKRLWAFVNLLRPVNTPLEITTASEVAIAAGLASSASGFAALTLALNQLFGWQLNQKSLSLIARLGSGSACRSVFTGFALWHRGEHIDGLDSFAEPLDIDWPELKLKILEIDTNTKPMSSRDAMAQTVKTSPLYRQWPDRVNTDLTQVKQALIENDFEKLGHHVEINAMAMHATMAAAEPSICYSNTNTQAAKEMVWQARKNGTLVYFTQDAGPNLKLLYLEKDEIAVKRLTI